MGSLFPEKQPVSISKGFTDLFIVLVSWKTPLNFLISINMNLKLSVSSSVSLPSFQRKTKYPISASPSKLKASREMPNTVALHLR